MGANVEGMPDARVDIAYQDSVVNAQEPVVRRVVLKESSASAPIYPLSLSKLMSAAQRRITEGLVLDVMHATAGIV